jgi:hypothetical protein
VREQRKLFGNSGDAAEDEKLSSSDAPALQQQAASDSGDALLGAAPPLVSYWHRNLTLALVAQAPGEGLPIGTIPAPVLQHIHVHADDEAGVPRWVEGKQETAVAKPTLFVNEFWLLREHMMPLNESVRSVQLTTNLYSSECWGGGGAKARAFSL